ncbi:glycosyltransferase family 2 protein [Adhaeretor mobilis]|uniref:Glycosyl transferase family 2 n=1 Tax=Adhaeretor mobilis TaxID=1930276 RepID=A0A517MPR7_9BACT|nr:glycosyltransferase family 2 protein [Adhaeretor mobilis]QDS96862.1 Glycosyl transferase family 2 [Adhaeretor mobilis]
MSNQLTVLIPCKDESLNILPCIESAQSIADEILVADSGSTDGTLEMVSERGGCRVIEREYVNSADFKNWAIPQASHPWVLILDADERITKHLAAEIRQTLANPDKNIDGYWIGRQNHFIGHRIKHCGWNRDGVIRLFRRDDVRYQERWVHAKMEIAPERVARLKETMLHYTTWSTDDYCEKLNRYANWSVTNYVAEGRQPSAVAIFLSAPLRFLQLYLFRGGFLDGIPGFQVCMYSAFYSFMKQAKLWEVSHGRLESGAEPRQAVYSAE